MRWCARAGVVLVGAACLSGWGFAGVALGASGTAAGGASAAVSSATGSAGANAATGSGTASSGSGAAQTTVVATAPTGAGSGAGAAVTVPPPAPGTQVMANDGVLRLDVNTSDGWFEVVDLRNGYVWQSGPPGGLPGAMKFAQNQTQAAYLEGQFSIGEIDVSRNNPEYYNNQFNDSQDIANVAVQQIPNGASFTYSFQSSGIQFTADLTLKGNQMIATVPYNQIFEQQYQGTKQKPIGQGGCPRFPQPPPTAALFLIYFPPECMMLESIDFLPAFGYGVPGQAGYLVIPDGSGALVNFHKVHPVYTNQFDMPVYGSSTQTPAADQWLPEDNMPIFGIVHTNTQNPNASAGMLAVITQGAANAHVFAVPAGQRAELYKAYVRFIYRPPYNALQAGLQQSLQYSLQPVPGNRQVTYTFVTGSQANYAGLAVQYRNYLETAQNAKPLPAKKAPPLLLSVFNGAREQGVPFAPFEAATTFAQAEQMAKDLLASGVQSIRMALEGWMINGYGWTTLPQQWPPAGQLGGVAGLRTLAQWGHSNNVQVALTANMYEGYQATSLFNTRVDSIHLESQLIMQDFGGGFLISPDVAENTLYPKLMQQMQSVGVQGTNFDYLARDVWPNYQVRHVLTRSQSIQDLMKMVSTAKSSLGTAGVQGGNTYAVGSANYFYDAPTADSGFNYESQGVPFWEIAVHGLALYSGRESNLLDSPTQQTLQMIEYGALPNWELTWQSPTTLRYTQYDLLYSSQFSQWEPSLLQQYKQEMQTGYAALAYVPITNNYELQPGVYVTTYQNGSNVIVNFNSTAVKLSQFGGVTVAAQNYTVIPGGGA